MSRFLSAWFLFGLLFVPSIFAKAQVDNAEGYRPLVLSDAVIPTQSKDPLTDPRVFNAEFYRKFNPELNLSTDADAMQHWTSNGASHCLRASFYFSAADYLKRYPDLGLPSAVPGACDYAIRQFVTYGFNQGRIGAFDSYPIVFDFNYYVDAANNPDLSSAYNSGTLDQVDIQIQWLRRGIEERRAASSFFNIKEYQVRYPDVSELSPEKALYQYVTQGQAERRLGRGDWADPSEWNALVAKSQQSVVTAEANDVVRRFTAANGNETTVTVKSPKWLRSPDEPFPATVRVCQVPPPSGNNDWSTLTTYLTPNGIKSGCDVVRLAHNAVYHLVLPQNVPPSQNYVLNHWPSLQIVNAQDFVFDGNGSTLFFTGPTTGIDIYDSQRVVVENLRIDWGNPVDTHPLWRGPLLAAIGTIVPDGNGSAHIVLDSDTPIPSGFRPYIYGFNLWDREKDEAAADDYLDTGPNDVGCDIYCLDSGGKLNPSQQSMRFKEGSLYPASNAAGQWVAPQLAAYPNRAVLVRFQEFAAVAIQDDYTTNDLQIRHTTVHTSPYMGITAGQNTRGLALIDVRETPSQGRPISTVADGSHFTGMSGDIVVEHSDFEKEGDDVMNITTVWDTLTAVNASGSFVMSGADGNPNAGDTLAFFDETMAFLGSAKVDSVAPANLPPWPDGPVTVQLDSARRFLKPGIYAVNMNHAPSRVYISDVDIHDKLGRGILLGGFHMLIRNSRFRNLTATAIASIVSNYFSESVASSDIAIRDNTILHTNYVPKLYQASVDSTNYYPDRNASIALFADIFSNYNNTGNEVTGIYPGFQQIEISGNSFDNAIGAGIYLTGTKDVEINRDRFTECGSVPDADPLYSYYGSESKTAVVLSFSDTVSLIHDRTTDAAACAARKDNSSSKDILIERKRDEGEK
jgi:Right handed beta helix region